MLHCPLFLHYWIISCYAQYCPNSQQPLFPYSLTWNLSNPCTWQGFSDQHLLTLFQKPFWTPVWIRLSYGDNKFVQFTYMIKNWEQEGFTKLIQLSSHPKELCKDNYLSSGNQVLNNLVTILHSTGISQSEDSSLFPANLLPHPYHFIWKGLRFFWRQASTNRLKILNTRGNFFRDTKKS